VFVLPSLYLRHGRVTRRDTVAEELSVIMIPEPEQVMIVTEAEPEVRA
jgi:hypothetical protein